jgi:xanthine dehydrogenase large subunit
MKTLRPQSSQSLPHESARLQVAGAAQYIDDIPEVAGTLHAAFGLAMVTHASIDSLDLSAVKVAAGVVAVIDNAALPADFTYGPVLHDDVLFARGEVMHYGQALFAVAATSHDAARRAARAFVLQATPLPVNLTALEGLAASESVVPPRRLNIGDLASVKHLPSVAGQFSMGGQEHFYLEGQIAYALPTERGVRVYSSTQHPSEVQAAVAQVCYLSFNDVQVETRRMGGAFGGKESQAMPCAMAAALLALKTRKPVKLRLDRDDDFLTTGKRHEFDVGYTAYYEPSTGKIAGHNTTHMVRGGISADFTGPVADRALFHAHNGYHIAHAQFDSQRAKTHTVSNTAYRGFGGPQGMLGMEVMIDDVARACGMDALDVRYANLLADEGAVTHYGQPVKDFVLRDLMQQLEARSHYRARRSAVAAWNASHTIVKRGLALTPVMFGVAFGFTPHNQGMALVSLLKDGTLTVQHGGTEMGQGLHTKVLQTVADVFGVPLASVRIQATDTATLPNMPATAASSGTDLCANAAHIAASTLRERIQKCKGFDAAKSWAANANAAYLERLALTEVGCYTTPDIGYDFPSFQGSPFQYFAYGAAVAEVMIDTLTGENRVVAVDILHDAGRSINPAIDKGQIEGAFVQGMGWLTTEELVWKQDGPQRGRLMTQAPQTYKIPTARDVPEHFNVQLYDNVNAAPNVHGSKAVGEPPFMLAISVFMALRDAVASCGAGQVALSAPATPEAVLMAIKALAK